MLLAMARLSEPCTFSSGDFKRFSVGVELVTNPDVLLLDEPTSGLDARQALLLVNCLRSVANTGCSMIVTIHQPSPTLFAKFDRLLVLDRGRVAYFSALRNGECTMMSFFNSLTCTPFGQCPEKDPAAWMLEVIRQGSLGATDSDLAPAAESYQRSQLFADTKSTLEDLLVHDHSEEDDSQNRMFHLKRSAHCRISVSAFRVLVVRLVKLHLRSPDICAATLMYFTIISPLCYSGFQSSAYASLSNVTEVLAYLQSINFIMTSIWSILGNGALKLVDMDFQTFLKEARSGCYSVATYILAWDIVDAIYAFCLTIYLVPVLYWTLGYHSSVVPVMQYWFSVFLFTYATLTFSLLIRACWSRLDFCFVVYMFATETFALFAGVFISYNNLSYAYKWIYWINPFHYVFERILVTQFGDDNRDIYSAVHQQEVPISSFLEFYFNGSFSSDHESIDTLGIVVLSAISLILSGVFLWSKTSAPTFR